MLEYRFDNSGDPAVLAVSGGLTLDNIVELRKILLEALNQAENTVINFENTDSVDLAFLQLLCSAHRMALASGKSLSLKNYPKPLAESIREAGLSSFVCRNDTWRIECLWPETAALPPIGEHKETGL